MKQLIIDAEHPNGVLVDITEEELKKGTQALSYDRRVVDRIREVYSVDDELAILRQRDTKPEEFAEYNDFVERIKEEEKNK
jgi:hypothetical protein